MSGRRIFISYSSREDPATLPLVQNLAEKLKKLGYGVLMDRATLQQGEDWRSAINAWCGLCDAALVVITPESIRNEFCYYEWSILGYRRMISLGFPIFAIYQRATPADLAGKPHQLAETQAYMYTDPGKTFAEIKKWAKTVVALDGPVTVQAKLLGDLLSKWVSDRSGVKRENARAAVKLELGNWEPLADEWVQFAFTLIGMGLKNAGPALAEFAGDFRGRPQEWDDVLDLIACSWVNHRSSRTLADRARGASAARNVALNAEEPLTARLYVIRACDREPSSAWAMASANTVAADREELISHVEEALARLVHLGYPAPPAMLEKKLQDKEAMRQPVIVSLNHRGLSQAWLDALRTRFPYVTFFILAGDQRLQLSDVEWLRPELDKGFEADFWEKYDSVKNGSV